MNLDYLEMLINKTKNVKMVGNTNPTIKICVDGEIAEIEEVSYDDVDDCLVVHDGSFDPDTSV